LLQHPTYSPDLLPLLALLTPQKILSWKTIFIKRRVNSCRRGVFCRHLPENYYSDGIHKLEERWNKCIEVEGNYTEK